MEPSPSVLSSKTRRRAAALDRAMRASGAAVQRVFQEIDAVNAAERPETEARVREVLQANPGVNRLRLRGLLAREYSRASRTQLERFKHEAAQRIMNEMDTAMLSACLARWGSEEDPPQRAQSTESWPARDDLYLFTSVRQGTPSWRPGSPGSASAARRPGASRRAASASSAPPSSTG